MIPETLTVVERLSLANQFRILAKLHDDESLLVNAEILEDGYTGRYGDAIRLRHNEVPLGICNETDEILNMYRRINNAIAKLQPEEKESLNLKKIEFEGFDANNDFHYGYMTFMVEKMDLWQEHRERNLNSHSMTSIMKYRKLLEFQRNLLEKKKYDLDLNDLKHMIEIA